MYSGGTLSVKSRQTEENPNSQEGPRAWKEEDSVDICSGHGGGRTKGEQRNQAVPEPPEDSEVDLKLDWV